VVILAFGSALLHIAADVIDVFLRGCLKSHSGSLGRPIRLQLLNAGSTTYAS
jgi:hypothetical protein